MMSTHKQAIDDEKKVAAEEQIRSLRKEIDYNTRDYTIDFLIQQFRNDEFYICLLYTSTLPTNSLV